MSPAGAAGQCADLLDDLRAGQLLGTEPRRQVMAQCFGVLVGSLVGCLVYRLLIPDPRAMLLTAEWPAPAVATWKAVAEVLGAGIQALPTGCGTAMAVAAVLGLSISVAQRRLPGRLAQWVPSGPALGLALVIPAWTSLSMALGAVAAALAARIVPGWSSRFVLALAAGLVAGESLAGIAVAMSAFVPRLRAAASTSALPSARLHHNPVFMRNMPATSNAGPQDSAGAIAKDVEMVLRLTAVPSILQVICQSTGMGFAVVARVTESSWTACAVRDEIASRLAPGDQLEIEKTLCREVRASGTPIVIESASADPVYALHHTPKLFGIESYISVPVVLRNGEYFGNLCAIDRHPFSIGAPQVRETFRLFAELIARQIDDERRHLETDNALAGERTTSELREQFIAVLGHDLRSPLGAVTAIAEIMTRNPDRARVVDLGTRLLSSTKRMSSMIDDVLDFARGRLGSGMSLNRSLEENLDVLMANVLSELQITNPGHTVDADIQGGTPRFLRSGAGAAGALEPGEECPGARAEGRGSYRQHPQRRQRPHDRGRQHRPADSAAGSGPDLRALCARKPRPGAAPGTRTGAIHQQADRAGPRRNARRDVLGRGRYALHCEASGCGNR